MGASTPISAWEHLNTSHDLDCGYIEGDAQERNVGKGPHADIQGYLTAICLWKEKAWAGQNLRDLQYAPTAISAWVWSMCGSSIHSVGRLTSASPKAPPGRRRTFTPRSNAACSFAGRDVRGTRRLCGSGQRRRRSRNSTTRITTTRPSPPGQMKAPPLDE